MSLTWVSLLHTCDRPATGYCESVSQLDKINIHITCREQHSGAVVSLCWSCDKHRETTEKWMDWITHRMTWTEVLLKYCRMYNTHYVNKISYLNNNSLKYEVKLRRPRCLLISKPTRFWHHLLAAGILFKSLCFKKKSSHKKINH